MAPNVTPSPKHPIPPSPHDVLLTGATGFLGTYLARCLADREEGTIYALVRAKNDAEAHERLLRLWWEWSDLRDYLGSGRIIALAGDAAEPRLGLTQASADRLQREVSTIIHAAANVRIVTPKEETLRANVEATKQMVDFARFISRDHPLKRFVLVSSAYVAGTCQGTIKEEALNTAAFNSHYEQSKHTAECVVREAGSWLPWTICRPAQILGDTKTGYVSTFNTLYYPLKLYLTGKLTIAPVSGHQPLNIVPVDYAAQAIVRALHDDRARNATLNLVVSADARPTVQTMADEARLWARENLDVTLPRLKCIPLPGLARWGKHRNLSGISASRGGTLSNILALAPYFDDRKTFDTTTAELIAGPCSPNWDSYMDALLTYATNVGFLNHSGRTVFEQMQVRRVSRSTPITYYDVIGSELRPMTGPKMAEFTRRIAASLLTRGLHRGDRIALLGVGSTDYCALDSAIGLIGAISVPLYFTTPPNEVKDLIERSRAKIVFIGMPGLLEQLAHDPLAIPVVALGDTTPIPETGAITTWDDFLQEGDALPASGEVSHDDVQLDDVATIRYTSGTTGAPKGVMFTQEQLRWMGSTMPKILDWKTRTGPLRYLSFLPMSHVVEGILVAYAPYYILSKIDLYYLHDFPRLVETLPRVRPTVFFSVPRFYEKLWEQFSASGAGNKYLSLKPGLLKDALRPLVRKALLRKAGLDKCRQLIVGSAPLSQSLFDAFAELGITLHDAYGLTEAPLITLNRRGKVDPGSVGDPLPETCIIIDEEGTVRMQGPQLAVGYDGAGPLPVDDKGYFSTGDQGTFSESGHVVLEGRRGDLMVTSYGKNLVPQKIELALTDAPLVDQAMAIGDAKPYCTALIWPVGEQPNLLTDADFANLDAQIEAASAALSHPEAPKRWLVLSEAPSIAAGQLTPNLKLKRRAIQNRYQAAIDALYRQPELTSQQAASIDTTILHVGSATR